MSIVGEIKNDTAGLFILKEWLGDGGKPVPQVQAESRAECCLHGNNGKRCPLNGPPGWLARNAKTPFIDWVIRQIEAKNRMKLYVQGEQMLNVCKACGCLTRLKVHTPIEHIAAHTPPEKIKEFPEWCWIRRELESRK